MPGHRAFDDRNDDPASDRRVGCPQRSRDVGLGGWVSHNDSGRIERHDTSPTTDVALIVADGPVSPFATTSTLPSAASLVERYRREGEQAFAHFNGLHSGVLVDRATRRTVVFNDRHGLDRIYYGETRDGLYFASEAKALLQAVPEFRTLNAEGVADLVAFGCVLGDRTLFRGIRSLPAGSLSVYENGRRREQRYIRYADLERLEPMSPGDFDAAFDEAFQATIREQFQAPSKIGLSLTGGVDSRLILAYKPELASETISYTFSGPDGDIRDVRVAAAVASACGLSHETIRLEQDFFDDFDSIADQTVWTTDGNFGISGAHELYLNEKARTLAPIRLSGVFGGELLRGVSTLQRQSLWPSLLDPAFLTHVREAEDRWTIGAGHVVTRAAFTETPTSLFGSLAACRSQVTLRAPYLDNRVVALAYRSPAACRTSPMWALERISRRCPRLGRLRPIAVTPTARQPIGGCCPGSGPKSVSSSTIWRRSDCHRQSPSLIRCSIASSASVSGLAITNT
jgi:asparagine synthase (glutamine-hydrolysing)